MKHFLLIFLLSAFMLTPVRSLHKGVEISGGRSFASIPAYALAAYTAWTRVYTDNHDCRDVLAGAAIGIGSAYAFSKWKKKNVSVAFNKSGEIRLVGLSYTF